MQCTAKSKQTGERCKAPAVRGKDKCRMHGGATPVKTGLYSKYAKTFLADRIEELKDDPALTDLREHIAFMTALLMDRLEANSQLTEETAQGLITIAEKLTKAIERWHKLTYGEKFVLQVEQVQVLVEQIVHIIREEIDDPTAVERVAKRLQEVKML